MDPSLSSVKKKMLHQLQFALLCYRLIVLSFHEVELIETRFNSWLVDLDFPQKNTPKSGQKPTTWTVQFALNSVKKILHQL